ncbi:CDP-alcohol phosphatidyltransferase family protein [Egibacter rhizosphaerae]|uniref:CDP-alcohol phosphatidyltransferase family protein n=2 Tax=Egibacter rhizosphaerae TaxID=1670831 RepID=A0A411YLK0_9ACTN|nr:CDP-alcohol phosphatidyltransferase family protein [Egibacter rhizosphaerae]
MHLAFTWGLARPPASPVPDRAAYFARWSALHGGYDPADNVWVRGWLSVAYALARPLARRGVHPDLLTGATVWLALVALATAEAGGRWPLLGVVALVASGLGDAVDGAVATLTERATRWGYVLDSLIDRVTDVLFVAALWRLGAPLELAAASAVIALLLDYLRARASNAGAGEIGTITVGERATRVILAALGLLAAGVAPAAAASLATASVAVLSVLLLAGLVHLLVAVHGRVR